MELTRKSGQHIRALREQRNYNQRFMADQLQMNTSTYCRKENGEIPISLPELERIAQVLGASPERLITGSVNPQHTEQEIAFPDKILTKIEEAFERVLTKLEKSKNSSKESPPPPTCRNRGGVRYGTGQSLVYF